MKTIEDAYEDLNGDIENTMFHNGAETTLSYNVRQLEYVTGYRTESNSSFQYICTVEEFNNYNPNPVYTQEMHEAGESPGVGMEVMFKHSAWLGARHEQAELMAITKEYLILQIKGQACENHFYIKDISFKPLTPPVKLVDGKAYLVTHKGNGHEYEVLYRKATDSFFSSKIDHPSRFFTNIQPLTVEK